MICLSNKNQFYSAHAKPGFTLPEMMAAVTILAIICSGVFVIIENSVESVANMEIRMQAFKVAQQNMEKILCTRPIVEHVDYGQSDIYPSIEWETTVEVVNGPYGSHKWARAVSSAQYFDADDEEQSVEFVHWVSKLTDSQVSQHLARQGPQAQLADQLLDTLKQAADFAGVTAATVNRWEQAGMPKTDDNQYVKMFLTLYKTHNGNPPRDALNLAIVNFNILQSNAANSNATGSTPTQNPTTPNPGIDNSENPGDFDIPDMPDAPPKPLRGPE